MLSMKVILERLLARQTKLNYSKPKKNFFFLLVIIGSYCNAFHKLLLNASTMGIMNQYI